MCVWGCSLLCERKVEIFGHSFKHPGVVGRNVLILSFNFQSKDFFFSNWNLKIHLRMSLFCAFVSFWVHKVTQNSTGQRVKRVIHQNKINNERVFLLEKCWKKMFAANLPVVTVNIPEPGWSLDLPLSATAVTTPVGCRFVAGHTVFTWKWIWKAAGLGRHTTQLNKNWEWSLQRDAVWEGVQSYCTGPSGSGRKHRRKRTKDILKYTPFDIDRNVTRNAIRYVLCWLYPRHCRFNTSLLSC